MPAQAAGKIVVSLAVLGLLVFNLFYQLSAAQVEQWDEARYVASTQEMLNSGNYLVNTYEGKPDYWAAKPPLPFWAAALGRKAASNPFTGMRLYSALAATLTGLLAFVFARRLAGFYAGALALVLLVTEPSFVLSHGARYADADCLFCCLLYGGLYCLLQPGRRGLALAYVALGLAFLVKGMQVLPFALTAFLLSLWYQRRQGVPLASLLGLPWLFWLPVIPWALARFHYDGLQFFHTMLVVDVFQRYTEHLEDSVSDWHIYLDMLGSAYGLLLPALALGLYYSRRIRPLAGNVTFVHLLVWLLLPLLVFSSSTTRFFWYCYPLLPALVALLASVLVTTAADLPLPALAIGAVFCTFTVAHNEQQVATHVVRGDMDYQPATAAIRTLSAGLPPGQTATVYLEPVYHGDVLQRDYATALLLGNVQTRAGGAAAYRQSRDSSRVYIDSKGRILRPPAMP